MQHLLAMVRFCGLCQMTTVYGDGYYEDIKEVYRRRPRLTPWPPRPLAFNGPYEGRIGLSLADDDLYAMNYLDPDYSSTIPDPFEDIKVEFEDIRGIMDGNQLKLSLKMTPKIRYECVCFVADESMERGKWKKIEIVTSPRDDFTWTTQGDLGVEKC